MSPFTWLSRNNGPQTTNEMLRRCEHLIVDKKFEESANTAISFFRKVKKDRSASKHTKTRTAALAFYVMCKGGYIKIKDRKWRTNKKELIAFFTCYTFALVAFQSYMFSDSGWDEAHSDYPYLEEMNAIYNAFYESLPSDEVNEADYEANDAISVEMVREYVGANEPE